MINLTVDGHIGRVTLDNPKKLNALGPWFWDEMPRVFREIEDNHAIRVVVLSANGRAFTAGLDLMAMMPRLPVGGGPPDGQRQSRLHQLIRDLQAAITCVERCRVPVIAAIHGHCIGGGIDLITAADIRLASSDAIFSVREVKMAIVADLGTLQRLPRIVGEGNARELCLTGRDFGADHAERIGLITQIHADREAVLSAADALAVEIAANPPLAVQGTKRVMNESHRLETDRTLEYVATYNAAHLITQDLGVAVTAFVSKQTPEYSGR